VKRRLILIILLTLLVAGSVYTALIFLRNSIAVELSEGQRYNFKDYEIYFQELHTTTCLASEEFVCTSSTDSPNVLLKITEIKSRKIEFANLGEVPGFSKKVLGLQVVVEEIDVGLLKANFRLTAN